MTIYNDLIFKKLQEHYTYVPWTSVQEKPLHLKNHQPGVIAFIQLEADDDAKKVKSITLNQSFAIETISQYYEELREDLSATGFGNSTHIAFIAEEDTAKQKRISDILNRYTGQKFR
jgi:hypothetical protein